MEFNEIANDFKSLKTHNWHKVWEPFMRKYNCEYVCELGVFKGENFFPMVAHKPKLAVAVDTWNNDGVYSPEIRSYEKAELDAQYENFKNAVAELPFVRIVRQKTLVAARLFPDNCFDFVYIDADHSAKGCYKDIIAWYPKVKPGKFLVGHDYKRGFGVVDAVNRFLKETELEMIFLSPSTWAVVKK